MPIPRKHIIAEAASAVSLSTSYAAIPVLGVPDQCKLSLASVKLTSVVTAVSVTWYLSEDAAGDIPITPAKTSTIVGQTSGKGGVADSLEVSYSKSSDGTAGTVWIQAKTNAGTASGLARIRIDAEV